VEFDLGFNVGSNGRKREKVAEVVDQVFRFDSLDLTACSFTDTGDRVDVTLFSFNGNEVDCDTFVLGNLSNLRIKLFDFLQRLLIIFDTIKRSKANVGKAISTDDNLGSSFTVERHSDRGQ